MPRLRGLAERTQVTADDPAEFLVQMNQGLSGILQKAEVTMFATAFFVVVDLARKEMRYSSAGHPAGIVRSADGASVLPLGERGPGPGLGLFQDADYETRRMSLSMTRSNTGATT